jgi:hypothetical protein
MAPYYLAELHVKTQPQKRGCRWSLSLEASYSPRERCELMLPLPGRKVRAVAQAEGAE